MKKIITLILASAMCISLCSCTKNNAPNETSSPSVSETIKETTQSTAEATTPETTTVKTENYEVAAPDGSTVIVNGNKLDMTKASKTEVPELVSYAMEFVDDVPEYVTLSFELEEGTDVAIEGKDSEGNKLVFDENKDNSYIAAVATCEETVEEIGEVVEQGLRAYGLYFVYQSEALKSYILYDSELYGQIFGSADYDWINVTFYNYEYISDYDFSVFEINNYRSFGNDCFAVDVKYHLDLTFSAGGEDNRQNLDATWVWVRDGESWSIADQFYKEQIENIPIDDPGVEVININEKTFTGTLLVVKDPSRVFCAAIDNLGSDTGLRVTQIMEEYNDNGYHVIAGINGGDFIDTGKAIYTGTPLGTVISEGEVLYADKGYDGTYRITGLTKDNKLVFGNYTVNEMLDMGVRDALHAESDSGPFLVENGKLYDEIPEPHIYAAGKNNRTAIGQREDGALLLLTVNGRQSDSLGATFYDLAELMLKYGAVNATAMDGGSSSQMACVTKDGTQFINHPFSPAFGPRACPTFWLVQ